MMMMFLSSSRSVAAAEGRLRGARSDERLVAVCPSSFLLHMLAHLPVTGPIHRTFALPVRAFETYFSISFA